MKKLRPKEAFTWSQAESALKLRLLRTSLVVQGLIFSDFTAGVQVRYLVGKLRSHMWRVMAKIINK